MPDKKVVFLGTLYTLILALLVAVDAKFTSSLTIIPEYAQRKEVQENGVKPERSPDVTIVLNDAKVTMQETGEKSLLARIVPETVPIHTSVLIGENDRLALFSYVESPDVRAYFFGLKDALQASFSAQVKDLIDITETPEGHPTRNTLSFLDPALSEEKLLFLRVRNRLYEFHIANGKEGAVQTLVTKLAE